MEFWNIGRTLKLIGTLYRENKSLYEEIAYKFLINRTSAIIGVLETFKIHPLALKVPSNSETSRKVIISVFILETYQFIESAINLLNGRLRPDSGKVFLSKLWKKHWALALRN